MIMVWQHIRTYTSPTENYPIGSCSLLSNFHVDDFLLIYSSISAFNIEETTGLPPFLPLLVMKGTSSILASSSFDSVADTKPTGMPTTSAGFVIPSLIMLMTSCRAVGALPIATIPPSMSLAAHRIAASDLVLPNLRACSATVGFEI